MWRAVPALLSAGLSAAVIEILWAFAFGHRLFLGYLEPLAYAVFALTLLPACVVLLGAVLRAAVLQAGRWRAVVAASGLLAGVLGVLLTDGRRIRESPLRPLAVIAVVGVGACVAWVVLRQTARARAQGSSRKAFALVALGVGCACLAIDARVLVRTYPVFHAALTLLALASISLAGVIHEAPQSKRVTVAANLTVLAMVILAPLFAGYLRAQPNASYVVERVAPWSRKALAVAARFEQRLPTEGAATGAPVQTPSLRAPGIDLRDRDILLITVDALRADVLAAYGGHGMTPELDALARESVVFRRAYTAAPHTSYALSSLMTGKFLKPLFELQGASVDPPTLPDLLRRYGYRTAAFYPPAIFFVDGARFEALRSRGFGFEYRKEMFASARERVAHLRNYLAEVDAGHPIFAWVHLFEPHEPYEPPAGSAHEDSARGRYDAEVRYCDGAIGELIRLFRSRRPGATVIVSADHGEEFGDHGGHYHGTTLFDEQVRVPLLWSSPGTVTPAVVDAPVELVDVGTSVLSAAGVPRDARMRGDDLGALLAGDAQAGPAFAFASVDDQHMVTDGRLKAVCVARERHCQLFDLERDPRELRNVAGTRESELARLRTALDAFLTSIPQVEALAVEDGVAFPAALTRARLGAPAAGADVIPLLADPRATVRMAAARLLGELSIAAAATMLDRLRTADPEPLVRAEAAVACLLLKNRQAATAVRDLLPVQGAGEGLSLSRRAALALASIQDLEALPVLSALAHDDDADEFDRIRAVKAMAAIGSTTAANALIDLLANVRLRVHAAEALGELGGRPAADALARALRDEPYQPARRAAARALQRLSDARTVPLVKYFLGMETSIPDGMRILLELGVLDIPRDSGALLRSESVRRGSWQCDEDGCLPGTGAAIELPQPGARRGSVRVTFLVQGDVGSTLVIDGVSFKLSAREQQLSMLRDGRHARSFALLPSSSVRVIALSVVPARAEIPAPAPEPWQGENAPAPTPTP